MHFPADIVDGTSYTIMVVEGSKAVIWTKPEDIPFDPDEPLPELGGPFTGGIHAAFFDGSVHTISPDADEALLRAAITRNGGEVLDDRLFAQTERRTIGSPGRNYSDPLKENQRLKQEYQELKETINQLKAEVDRAAIKDEEEKRLHDENRRLAEDIQKLKDSVRYLQKQLQELKQGSDGAPQKKRPLEFPPTKKGTG